MKHSQETKAEARRLYAEGVNRHSISKTLGASYNTVSRWVVPGYNAKEYARVMRQHDDYRSVERDEPTLHRCKADLIGLAERLVMHRRRIKATFSRRQVG